MSKKKKKIVEEQIVQKTDEEIRIEQEQMLKKKQYDDALYDIGEGKFFMVIGIVVIIIFLIWNVSTIGAKHQSAVATIDRVENLGINTLVRSMHSSHTYKYNYYVHFIWNGQEYNCVTMATLQKDHPGCVGEQVKVYFDESIKNGAKVDLELEYTYFKWIMLFYYFYCISDGFDIGWKN